VNKEFKNVTQDLCPKLNVLSKKILYRNFLIFLFSIIFMLT
jgi:hypothetical protein